MMVRLHGDKILLVECHSTQLMSRGRDLEKHGYKVIVATTCEEALQTIGKTPGIVLMLMDSDLDSGIGGMHTAEQVQKKYNVPVVFITSHTDSETIKKIERITPYGFVARGSDSSQLAISIKMALRLFEANQNVSKVLEESKQAYGHLQFSEQRFKWIIENANDIIFTLSPDGLFTYVSPQWLEFMGEPAQEAIGKSFEPYVHPDDVQLCRGFLKSVLTTDENPGSIEYRVRRKDGSWRWHVTNGSALKDSIGNVNEFVGIARDVTEQQNLRKNLELSEQTLRQVIDLVPHFIFAKDVHGTFLLANKAVADAYGTSLENLLGKNDHDFNQNTAEVDFFIECDKKVIESGTGLYNIEETITDAKGSRRTLQTTKIPFTASECETPAILGVSVDITERKRAEERLVENEAVLRDILESTLSGYWDWNLVDNTEYLSPTFKRMFGYEDHEMESSPEAWQKIIFSEDLPGVLEVFSRHVKSRGRDPFYNEVRYRHKDGSTVWVICAGRVIEWTEDYSPIRMVGCHINITERKRGEEALIESEDRFRKMIEGAPDAVFVQTEKKFAYLNTRAVDLFGADKQTDLLGKPVMDRFHPDYHERILQRIHRLNEQRQPVTDCMEQKFLRLDGSEVWVETTGQPIVYEGKNGALVFVRDITDRKRAEEEMLKLSLAVEQSNATIVITDLEGRIQYANAAFAKTTGYSVEEAIGQNSRILKSGQTPSEEYKKLWNTITLGGEWNGVFHNKRKDGSLYWESAKIAPIRDTSGNIMHYLAVKEDITERKMASDALEKLLEEKNILLSEIHHRVKNNMAIISSLITLQTDYFSSETPDNQLVDIRARIESMALVHEIVYEQKNFAGINFARLLNRLIDHLQNIYQPKDKNISVQIRADDTFLDMNKSVPLTLLICEVVTNAWKHAFSGRQAGNIQLELKKKENEHCLMIQDDGVGVANMDQIHNANSLGWTIIHGLANQLRGDLSLSSPKGGGFRVEVRFPEKKVLPEIFSKK